MRRSNRTRRRKPGASNWPASAYSGGLGATESNYSTAISPRSTFPRRSSSAIMILVIRPDHIAHIAHTIPGARLVVLKGVGHPAHSQDPNSISRRSRTSWRRALLLMPRSRWRRPLPRHLSHPQPRHRRRRRFPRRPSRFAVPGDGRCQAVFGRANSQTAGLAAGQGADHDPETFIRVFVDGDALDRTVALYADLMSGRETLRFALSGGRPRTGRRLSAKPVLIIAGSPERPVRDDTA